MKELKQKISTIIQENSHRYVYEDDAKTIASKILELPELKAIQVQAKVIVNFADIENKLKAVTQIVDIGIFAENAMIEGLIADQRVIAYKDALRICKELVSKISK